MYARIGSNIPIMWKLEFTLQCYWLIKVYFMRFTILSSLYSCMKTYYGNGKRLQLCEVDLLERWMAEDSKRKS